MTTTALLPPPLPGELLVSRLHVDLLRVATATCPGR
ncbi:MULTISPECIES: putative leader peptide [unclassified Modestobacter]